jgi:diguanylate cyclase (GGDEF)-like protein
MEGPVPASGGVAPARDASGDEALAMAILEPSQLFIARLTTGNGRVVDVEVPAYVAASGFGRPVQTYDALVFWSAVETRVRWAQEHGGRDHFMVLLPSGKQSVRIVSLGAKRWAVEWHPSEPVGVEEAPPYSQSFSDDQRLATVLLDDGAIITWANERFGKLTDFDGELSGQDLRSVLPADMRTSIDDLLRAAIDTGTADRLVPSVQPIPRWLRVRASPVTQVVSGKPLVVLRIEDVIAPEDGPADWTDEIVRDPLTGLYNRRAFFDIAALDDPLDSPFVAVLLADVRRFRRINDGWGQTVADLALAEVAKWLRRAALSSDVLIRMAGDQFIALCTSGSQLIAELEASPEIPVASAASPLLVTVNAVRASR